MNENSQVSPHFARHEFACRCGCGFDTADVVLVMVLEDVRRHFGRPVIITGPNRCAKQNAATPGASSKSMHMVGKAADIRVFGIPADTVADYLEAKYPDRFGIGRYHGRTHIDVRDHMARWDKR